MRGWIFVCRPPFAPPWLDDQKQSSTQRGANCRRHTHVFLLVRSGERQTQTLQITKIRRFQPQGSLQTTLQVKYLDILDLDFTEIMWKI